MGKPVGNTQSYSQHTSTVQRTTILRNSRRHIVYEYVLELPPPPPPRVRFNISHLSHREEGDFRLGYIEPTWSSYSSFFLSWYLRSVTELS